MEVTFEEARAHLGIETQRQWSDLAIARTTPVLLGVVRARVADSRLLAHAATYTSSLGSLVHKRATDLRRCDGTHKAVSVEELPFFNVESKA